MDGARFNGVESHTWEARRHSHPPIAAISCFDHELRFFYTLMRDLEDVLETMGQHLVIYASDYAHWDSEFPESVRMLASIPGLTDEQKRHVLGRNAVAWFGLTPAELPATSVYFQREEVAALQD